MSALEIHHLGLNEVSRIHVRYQTDVMDCLGFKGTFHDFVNAQKSDPRNFCGSSKALLAGYKVVLNRIKSLIPIFFDTFPNSELEIVEKSAPNAPCAYYITGTQDGSRPGRFYVNVSNLSERPKYEMIALALHEGIPGHHHQGAIAIETPSIPNFMRFIEDRRYEFAPARRQLYTGYLEGWALYCEALGEEMGLYEEPLDLFGRLSMEMMRAVRLVVDTGIHELGWSVQQAIEYMQTNTGMAFKECEAECYRYEAWPGQACAYKVGEVAIWNMRKAAEKLLGSRFDLKAFHRVLLNTGPMPLDLLANEVSEWAHGCMPGNERTQRRYSGHDGSPVAWAQGQKWHPHR